MAATTDWFLPNRVLITTITEVLTMDDVRAQAAIMAAMIRDSGHTQPVHLLVDSTEDHGFAADMYNFIALREAVRPALKIRRPTWLVVVDPNPNDMMTLVAEITMKLVGIHLRITRSMDEALQFLAQQDPTLDFANIDP